MKRTSLILALAICLVQALHAESIEKETRIGLCLSGGGALGFAHIGAIQALKEHGIVPHEISGTSMGAIIGTMYAAGYSPIEMLEIIQVDEMYSTFNLLTWIPKIRRTGLASHEELRKVLQRYIPSNSFDKLKRKMHVCVTNLNTGKAEIISSGKNLDMWVAASASIPGVFESIKYKKTYYTDGGVVNNFPAEVLSENCDVIIGIDVVPYIEKKEKITLPHEIITQSIRIALSNNSIAGKKVCDHVIESNAAELYNEFNFGNYKEIYLYGYESTRKYLHENDVHVR